MTRLATPTQGLLAVLLLLAAPGVVRAQTAQSQVIDNGTVQTIVYNNGNIGGDCSGTNVGFAFQDDPGSYLCGAGFLLGISEEQVIGEPYMLNANTGWQPGTIGESTTLPYPALESGVQATFADNEGVGVSVVLNAYYSSAAPNDEFVVFEYRITNTADTDLEGVYPGLFVDWDLGPGNNWDSNQALVNEAEALMYAYDPLGGTTNHFGQAALTAPLSGWEYFIDYPPASGQPHDQGQMWNALTIPGQSSAPPQDQRSIIGTGPYDIPAGESITVAFAILASTSETGIVENVQAARLALSSSLEEAIHDTGVVQLEAFASGFIGSYADPDGEPVGTGFAFNGDNGLYEGQLLVGISPTQVSGEPYSIPNEGYVEWNSLSGPVMAAPPQGFDQAFAASFDDGTALNPIGVTVTQTTYSADGDPFVIADYTVTNTSGSDLSGVYIGMFADWDIGNYSQNRGGYVAEQQLLYAYDGSGVSTNYFGVTALRGTAGTTVSGVHFDVLPGDGILYTALTTIRPDATAGADRRTVIGVGPYDIAAGESVQVQFAYVGGESLDDIIANAATAQGTLVAIEETTPAGTFVLHSAYPNPMQSSATLGFTLSTPQHVRLTVYDLLGRRVATLVDEARSVGEHSVVFDASGLPGGTYLYRLEAGGTSLTQRLTVLR